MNRENIESIYRLSPVQQGMLFHTLYAPQEGVYFEQINLPFGAGFDPLAFERIWRELVERNPSLRTSFVWKDLEEPVQVVHRRVDLPFEALDWRDLPEAEREAKLQERVVEDRRRGFDLLEAPLLRLRSIRLRDDLYHVTLSYHHLILDGWSVGLLLQEVGALYPAAVVGRPLQVQQRRPFRDYIAWLRQQDLSGLEDYWRRMLGGFTTPTPLGVDRPAGKGLPGQSGRDMRKALVPEGESEALKAWARKNRLTLSTVVQGAWSLVLSRYSGENDLVYGLTVSGRPPTLPGVEAMLGCFINTLPVRVRLTAGESLLSWLQALQADQAELRRYEHSPLVEVQGWSDVPRPTPLFESIFVFEGFTEATLHDEIFQRTGYPLNLVVGPDREILLRFDYELERFEPAAVERLLGHLKSVLSSFAADPDRRLAEVDILTPEERGQLLAEVRTYPSPLCLHEIFASQVARTPDAPAVTFEGESLSYRELNERANRLAHHLQRLGVGPESRVGLCVDRSLELVAGVLGILKAGGAYVPLDPRYPASRLSYIAEDSGIAVVVTTEDLRDLIPGVEVVGLESSAGESTENPESGAGPENLAYVIYTSGSTGQPKGSLITHGNVTRLFAATEEWFHFGECDVWSLFHSYAFDFSVWEIWGALLYGGRLVVVPYWVSRSPEAFHELLVKEQVTVLNQTPSAFRQLVQAEGDGELSLRYVVFGGEALELSSLGPWFDRHGDEKPLLVNMYGITETTVHVTWRAVRRTDLSSAGPSPIGVPIPDLGVQLRDRHGRLVPIGVAGEMYVSGAGVARGYLGRPELTAERFVPDPFGGAGERLYRSGDLARWLPDRDMEYLGRIDHQVKVRGFRIELGEIEAVLGGHPGVREAVVLPREEESGDRRLVGYVVPREDGIDVAELRAFLKDRLPDYMVPSALVEIAAIPLTAHGKVDRRALPDPAAPAGEKALDAPRTPVEELVAGIWSEILRVERVNRSDSFFDLGGHSLLATRVTSRLREVLGVDLPLRTLFESPTLAELAPRIEAARSGISTELPPLVRGSRDGDLPLSFSQERLWFLDQLQPGTAVYNIPNAVRMNGVLDVAALRRSLSEVVRRHEALRTIFAVEAGRPVQVIREDLQPALPLIDLSAVPKREIHRLTTGISNRPFDLAAGPLLRATLLRVGESEHVLLLTFHHIISDAWSLEVLMRELGTLYAAFAAGLPSPLPELPVQYADFARWQRQWLAGEALEAQLAYWRERLAGVPVLQLPGDHPRPAVQSYVGSMCGFAFPEPLAAGVHALAKARGATVFMVLLAAYQAMLSRLSGQEDFAVGSPVAGRERREIEGLIGFFINTLVLRAPLAGVPAFTELLDRVRGTALEAYAHQAVPFERIVQELAPERNLSYPPLFQAMLSFQSLGGEGGLELPGLTLAPMNEEFPVSKFDLTLTAFDAGSRIFGQWVYSTALFERETIARWAGHFQVLLEGLVADPARRIPELPLLTAGEREQILVEWNRPPVDYPEEGFVHQLFEAQVEETPEAVAVVFEGETLTYRELNTRANRLARHLRRQGAGPEVLVGISAERSFEMVVGLLAILKAGSAYLPLDPSLPAERLSYMKEDAGIALLLTQDLPDCSEEGAENLLVPVEPDNPAYVIYTSGSTGQPKGVVVSHRALANRLQYARAGDVLATDAFLQKTTISFDVSLLEVFAPLVIGGRTVLAKPGGQQDPEYLVRLIREQRITYTSFPPSLLYVLFEQEGFDRCDSLRVVITGGETVPAVLPGQFYERLPGAALLNRYGPTEATISVTSWLCERDTPHSLPIGRPTAKARVYLLDANLQPVPVGITGEIFLGGTCVARGYLGRPELTAEVFVPDPFGEPGARLYRTGDLARYRPDGAIEFVGRVDQQVKIRGFRVELGEIEAALARHPGVQEAAVVDREEGPSRSLAAYLVFRPGESPDEAELRSFLLETLPAYMVPADFVVLEALPLSPTGKVDRKALPAPRRTRIAAEHEEPHGPVEEILAGIYGDVLRIERVSRTGDFFELGGHSLLATQVVSRVRESLGVELPLRKVFERPVLADLAVEIESAFGGGQAPPLQPSAREGEIPLSFAQERLWFLDQLQPGSPAYNMPAAVRLQGTLDVEAFRRALQEVVCRHESLRTRFAVVAGRPVQRIADELPLAMPVVDLQHLLAEEWESAVGLLAAAERRRPFDLATGPLIRATLLRTGTDEHVALLTLHHIVADGWSVGVLIREIGALYPAFLAGEGSPLPELPVQYADFAVWQREWLRGEVLEAQLDYWRQRLTGHSTLELPTDRPRPAVQRFDGADEPLALPAEVGRAFLDLGRRQGSTSYMALLAGFQILLHRYSGQDDVVLGATVAGRNRRELEPLIGFFVNSLAMRADLSGRPTVRETLARVREVALGALSHQDLPFEKLVEELAPERDLSRSPLFQVVFQLHNATASAPLELPGLTLSPVRASGQTAKFDIVLNLGEAVGGALGGAWSYNTDLFDRATMTRMSRHFESLLAAAAADPDSPVAELPLLTDAERRQLGLEWNGAPAEPLDGPGLHQIFAAQAARAPEAVAVTCEGLSLSYGELDRRSNHLAHFLIDLGISPGDLVGLCLERSIDMVVAILGVLKAGGAYVPLDPAYPRERLAFMLEDSRVPMVLAHESVAEALPEATRVVFLEGIAGESAEAPAAKVPADAPAYVIYTSGSTGKPKGVVVRHGNATRLFTATDPWFGFHERDVWTLFHSYAFDFSVWEIWGALLYGGRLVVVPWEVSRSPAAFHELLVEERVTVLNQTPSAFRQLIWADRSAPDLALRYVIFGGEALEPSSLAPWFERHGDQTPRLINMYGITETTVHVTYRPIGKDDVRSVVGRAIPDLGLYLLDASGQPQPVGVPGEIHVGGAGLALGYLGRPELTAERFVPNPCGEPGSRLYRSGDLARFLADGDLEYLGRIDHQVKIRGFRIELGEIESALAVHPAVREAVVLAREDGAEKRLVAYVVPEGEAPSLTELRDALAGSLPDYMLPSALVVLDQLPLTANGKVDRRVLPAPDSAWADLGDSYAAPATGLERFLAGLWREVLKVPQPGVHDDFFALGGSSISGAVLINRLQEELGEIVQVVVIFDAPTVAELAAYLIEQHPAAVARMFGPEALGGRELDPEEAEEPIGEAELAELRRRVRPLAPQKRSSAKNPPALFVLSPPRSGSTLLRVMLGGHPGLFSPPELELLSFNTLRERKAAFQGRDAFWLEGVIRAVMEIRGCGAEEAEALVEACEREDLTTLEFYGRMQEWLGGRMLVDKTPSYALDPEILRRAEEGFAEPRYLHLIRHPLGMIRSFEEAKLDQIFFRQEHPFTRRRLAELIWLASHENIVEFLEGIPAGRQHWVRFEEILREPERTLRGICEFLGVDYHPDMAEPYKEASARMTDGVHAESRMLGDVKFREHRGVDRRVAESWRDHYTRDFLGDVTWRLASRLGYEIESERAGAGRPLVRVPRDRDLPLSFAQQRLWFLEQLQPGTATYNVPFAVRFRGTLDTAALHRSLQEVARRHEALRTTFAVHGGAPVQSIAADLELALPRIDLRGLPQERREEAVRRLGIEERRRPFDLAVGPLIRATLVRSRGDEHVVLLTLHHIVADGWSVGVLIREIAALYPAFLAGAPSPLPELPVQYADFAVWQREWLRGEVLESQLAYWRERLSGHAVLQLPTDRPRPAVQRFRGAGEPLAFAPEVSRAFLALGTRQRMTAYMALLAGFQALLHRYSGQDDVIVGSTVAGRDRRELEPLIGFFVNTLVMRADLAGRPTVHELLARVRQVALGALRHQGLPFEKLVEELQPERDLSRSPLFQVVFQLQNASAESLELPGLILSPVEGSSQSAKFDIVLNLRETGAGLIGGWSYNTDLFDRATMTRMSRHFENLLAGAAADPDRAVADLPLLTEAERRQLGLEWNGMPAESEDDSCLHEIFMAQAAWAPQDVAVRYEGRSLSYGELDRRSNWLAWHLTGLGVSPGDLVGLCLQRSIDMVVAILGVLKAGGAYVPLDPAYPRERLAFMLEDSRVPVLLTQESVAEALPEIGPATRVVFLDGIEGESAQAPWVPMSAVSPAYVIYTSGSTGRPKGVVVRHGNAARLFSATRSWFDFNKRDVWTLFHSYAFDFSVWEIWGALLYGGRLVVVPWEVSRSPTAFHELLVEEKVTVLNQTPSAFRQLIWAEESALDKELALRYVIFGGEALEPASLAPWFARHGDQMPRLINMYGITETTVHVTYRPIGKEDVSSVVGRPIPDLGLYVLDASGQPQPLGVPGEIHVGGAGLALGYLGRPELTAERFVPNPFGEPGSRLYRSGDLARFLADGDLEYLGRIDHQVKIRGFRIELGEIESALVAHPAVREAVVLAREDGAEKRLVAYVVPDGEAPNLTELRDALAGSLPDYMLPSALVMLDQLPLTANGKVDRRALPAPEAAGSGLEATYVAPATDLERFLADLWQEALKVPQLGVHDDFFARGGSSITGAVLVARLQEKLREIVHVVVIFDYPTIAEMSAYLIDQHPKAVARLFGPGALGSAGERRAEEAVGEADLAELRRLVRPLAALEKAPARNPRAVFVLSPPRSGSTLMRVMLGGHPRLFSPPELELLSFNTLRERRAAFQGRDAFWLEGVIRAVMEIRGCGAEEAEALVAACEREGLTTLEFYGRMQEWLGDRVLVDKTPSYALDPAILRRAEEGFAEPRYIHLIRHPLGMVHSFEEAKLDQLFFRHQHPFSRRQLAELIWRASHENIVEFLRGVPAGRQHWVRFEDLLREPEAILRGICEFLEVEYHPDMALPYKRKSARMTDGVHAESRMLGDVKFHQYQGVDPRAGERWRESHALESLGAGTRDLAAGLGYDAGPEGGAEPWSPIPSVLVGLQPGGSEPPLFLVHPLSGELFLYRHLVAALGPEQPVYGFQAVGFATEEEPLTTVEGMAALYVNALLSFQPGGPYRLAGSSLGGLIAFEMARKLRSLGREVSLLALLDAPDPARFTPQQGEAEADAELSILQQVTQGKPPVTLEQLRELTPEERLRLILDQGRLAGTLAASFGLPELRRLVRVVRANRQAVRAYEPQPFDTSLFYIRAAEGLGDDAVWAALALGGAEVQEAPGGHLSMHFPPYAEPLAARLRSCIERSVRTRVT